MSIYSGQEEYEAQKEAERKRMFGEEASKPSLFNDVLQGMKAKAQQLQHSDYWLENVIPKKPDYLSKTYVPVLYYSRYTFEEIQIKPQQIAAELGLLFGVIALVTAIPTAGGSLYLLAVAEGAFGVAQIYISSQKLHDLSQGIAYSEPKFLGISQETLDNMGIALSIVNLSMLAKHGILKSADKVKNLQKLEAFREAADHTLNNAKRTIDNWNVKLILRITSTSPHNSWIREPEASLWAWGDSSSTGTSRLLSLVRVVGGRVIVVKKLELLMEKSSIM